MVTHGTIRHKSGDLYAAEWSERGVLRRAHGPLYHGALPLDVRALLDNQDPGDVEDTAFWLAVEDMEARGI